ncbi:MAG TPA: type II 3-dehydroquinate dehydratase [Candidatus Cybelea sp.]|nr:type II 3-dehydroquinate dehydratase [Candidatus Cybelea sp.]
MAKPPKRAISDVLVLNGPNLNLLGRREPEIYGRESLDDIARLTRARAEEFGLIIDFRQTNHEGELITWVQQARESARAIVINPAGLGHTSVALLDALIFTELPVIEVHLSNIFRREPFRHHSYVSAAAKGVICGLGAQGYLLAIEAVAALLNKGAGRNSKKGRA